MAAGRVPGAPPFTDRRFRIMMDHMTSTLRRFGVLDVIVATALTAVAVVYMASEVHDDRFNASPLAVPLFAAITIPLLWRRVAPLAALAATFGGLIVHA